MNQIRWSVVFSFETSFQASRSSVLPFLQNRSEKTPVAHSHSAVINPEIPQPFMAHLWFPHHSNTNSYTDPLRKQRFLSFENIMICSKKETNVQEMMISLHHTLTEIIRAEFVDMWSCRNASLSKDLSKAHQYLRANGVYDLCLLSGKALKHAVMGLHANWGINT